MCQNPFFLVEILPKALRFHILARLVKVWIAKEISLGWARHESLMMPRKEVSVNQMVLRRKGHWPYLKGSGFVLTRIGCWLEEVLGRWRTFVSSKRSFQWELARTLSRRFIIRLVSLLFV